MRAAEHAPRDPFRVLERRHGLAEIVERGAGVPVKRHSVIHPHTKTEFITLEVRPTLERDTIVSVEKESFLSLNAESFRVYLEALSMDELADVLSRYEHELTAQQRGLVAEVIAAYDRRRPRRRARSLPQLLPPRPLPGVYSHS